MLEKSLISIRVGNDDTADLSDRSSFQSTSRFSALRLCSLQLQTTTQNEMPLNHRFRCLLFVSVISALILKSSQDSIMPTNKSSPSKAPGRLGLTLGTITNQSERNDVSIHCETGRGSQFGRPRPVSCSDALEHIPRDADLLFFGKRGTAPQGAYGLPYRYISCKP